MLHYLTSIVAIDKVGAIGCRNSLPWRVKTDLKFFRNTTRGHPIIMGRKTFDSIGNILPDRTNIVLSHNSVLFQSTSQCRLANSVGEAIAKAISLKGKDTYIIGGATTYEEFSPYVDSYFVSFIEHQVESADAFIGDSVREAISSWKADELEAFPAVEGQDDYAFRIVKFTAPDADMRREARKALTDDWLSKGMRKPSPRSRRSNSVEPEQPSLFR